MGDGGLTVGGACYKNFVDNHSTKIDFSNVYLGKSYENNEIYNLLNKNKDKINFTKMEDRPVEISKELEKNLVVGYFDGRMEFGPRALGSKKHFSKR